MKAFVIVQGIEQLQKEYGREESIMSNCGVRIAFTPNKMETAEVLSKLTGKGTIVQRTSSRSGKVGEIGSVNANLKETGRELLTPDECMRLKLIQERKRWWSGKKVIPGETLTFVGGVPPIRGRQALYFQNRELRRRASMAPPMMFDDKGERI